MLQPLSPTNFREPYYWSNANWGNNINYLVPKAVSVSCPHCGVLNAMIFTPLVVDVHLFTISGLLICSSCGEKSNLWLMEPEVENTVWKNWNQAYIYPPQKDESSEVPPEVDDEFRKDFREAALTLPISPRASAALSRYCLQKILRLKAGVTKGDLYKEIEEVIDQAKLPTYLLEQLDAIRHIGNFAVHPNEDKISGEIIDIDEQEAAWVLEIIRDLLDFYFVKPAKAQQRKDAFNEKMKAAGKKPMA